MWNIADLNNFLNIEILKLTLSDLQYSTSKGSQSEWTGTHTDPQGQPKIVETLSHFACQLEHLEVEYCKSFKSES
jgi:hypothetical protein